MNLYLNANPFLYSILQLITSSEKVILNPCIITDMIIHPYKFAQNFQQLFRKQKIVYIKTYGNSMFPLFLNDDSVGISKVSFSSIQINDIISHVKNHCIITHRVIYKNGRYLITKGDANFFADEKVLERQILGKIIYLKRRSDEIKIDSFYHVFSQLYQQEISAFCKKMDASQLRYTILKGLPVHLYYQKKIPHKFYADCDVLVDKKDWNKITKLFQTLGFMLHGDRSIDGPEIQFSKKVGSIKVTFDVHFEAVFMMTRIGQLDALYESKNIMEFTEDLFTNSRKVTISGVKMNLLNLEYQLIYLVLHLFHHNFKGYARYWLIADIINNFRIDQNKLGRIINAYKLNNYCYPVFLILHKYFTKKISGKFLLKILADKAVLHFIEQTYLDLRMILSDERNHEAGVQRFKLLFLLSPYRVKRYLVFLHSNVIFHIYRIALLRIYTNFRGKFIRIVNLLP
jgi:signal peptidase I